MLQTKLKTILDIVNYISYKHAKSQCDILFIMGYTKMTKSDIFWRFENMILRYTLLLILCSLKYTFFKN
jgi:hypothetical protein